MSNEGDWKRRIGWNFPYKGLNDPEYIKARDRLFKGHHGWWWGRGWWSKLKYETPMEYHARKRKEREAKGI